VSKPHYLIETFTNHRLASNILMIIMVLAGVWGLQQINVQLNPTQNVHRAEVQVAWPGAGAEDVERLVTQPLEYQLRTLKDLVHITSRTSDSLSAISLNFKRDTDMGLALDRIKQSVAQARNLPDDIEPPVIQRQEWNELVGAIMLSGKGSLDELVPAARKIQRDLLARGVDIVEFRGVPAEEIAIQVESKTLYQLGVPLETIARKILELSSDVPAGSAGRGQVQRQLRSLDQQRDVAGFEQLPLQDMQSGALIRLGDIADIERREKEDQRMVFYEDKPAIMLRLRRNQGTDTLESAQIMQDWLEANQEQLAQQGIQANVFLEAWRFAVDQIGIVLKNGASGLVLVILILFLFLNGRVAWWVMLGIPVSYLVAIAVFYSLGGTINFISMIGVVMGLGIVVDDAIVVGEHALSQFQDGKSPAEAAASGTQKMFAPVMASSLTTLAAFLPLIMIDEPSISQIPLLMICVIIASLIECFLVLPGHLRSSFEHMGSRPPSKFRQGFDRRFESFKNQRFRPLLGVALNNRRSVLALTLVAFLASIALLASGRIKPDLNINLDFDYADAYVQFAGGTSEEDKFAYLKKLEQAAIETNADLGGDLVVAQFITRNWAWLEQEVKSGIQYATVSVELTSPDQRTVTLDEFNREWKSRVDRDFQVEILRMEVGDQYWPDISLYFSGADTTVLKAAAEELAEKIATYPGVSNVYDDLPYGEEQWIFSLTTEGRASGLSSSSVGRQIRAAYDGYRVQIFTENDAELEVRVMLPEAERNNLGTLRQLPIATPAGGVLPLATVADVESRRGIQRINHRNALKAVNVYANIDTKVTTGMEIVESLEADVIPGIAERHNISYGLGEGSAGEAQLFADMRLGAVIGLALIYLILAWIFSSYSWPLAVMIAIPLGLTGALFGLFFLGLNLGALALMGLFTLTGVIVNDSIILISAFKECREQGMTVEDALDKASAGRLRPVILTSLTTTFGLAPMMLESSPMGEMMAPLAVVICFGLLYGTTLILFVIPAMLSVIETLKVKWGATATPTETTVSGVEPLNTTTISWNEV
jgi:multidrug efflux pump subunit AcrB